MMKRIKAVLVDDRISHLNILKKALALYNNDIEIIGAYSNAAKAIAQIIHLKPDVLFLDIAMPGKTGFDLAAAVSGICDNVIYLTHYMQYGPDSYKHKAIYFIDKDRMEEFLAEAIARLKIKLESTQTFVAADHTSTNWCIPAGTHQLQKISIPGNRKVELVLFDGTESRSYQLALNVESSNTLTKFILFIKFGFLFGVQETSINQKHDKVIFANLSQSKTHFIKDVNNQLSAYNITLRQQDFFREEIRGRYTFAINPDDIVIPTDPEALGFWLRNAIQPVADALRIPFRFYADAGMVKARRK